jgi:hypothetical protein
MAISLRFYKKFFPKIGIPVELYHEIFKYIDIEPYYNNNETELLWFKVSCFKCKSWTALKNTHQCDNCNVILCNKCKCFIHRLNLHLIRPDSIVCIIGKRQSKKTFLIKDLLQISFQNIQRASSILYTDLGNKSGLVESSIFLDENIKSARKINDLDFEKHMEIADFTDCIITFDTSTRTFLHGPCFELLCTSTKRFHTSIILSVTELINPTPWMRLEINHVFIFPFAYSIPQLELFYIRYKFMFTDFQAFLDIVSDFKENQCIVFSFYSKNDVFYSDMHLYNTRK